MPSSGSGEERTWTIRVCPVHGVLPTQLPVPSHEACPAAIETVDVVSRAEREAREKADGRIKDLRFEVTGLHEALRKETARAEKAEEALRQGELAVMDALTVMDPETAKQYRCESSAYNNFAASLSALPVQKECTCGNGEAEEDRGAVLRCPVHSPVQKEER